MISQVSRSLTLGVALVVLTSLAGARPGYAQMGSSTQALPRQSGSASPGHQSQSSPMTAHPTRATIGGAAPSAPAAQAPQAYLDAALTFLQQHAVRAATVDWPVLRREAAALARHARTTAETYPAIRLAVRRLGDHHSQFLDPAQVQREHTGTTIGFGLVPVYPERVVVEVFPGSAAARAGVRVGDTIVAIDGRPARGLTRDQFDAAAGSRPPLRLTLRRAGQIQPLTVILFPTPFAVNLPPEGQRLPGAVGYLALPILVGGLWPDQYASAAQGIIRRVDQPATCGWVVDLRRDLGGDLWPMLAGVGPILGTGTVGAFVGAQGRQVWGYRAGQAVLDGHVMAQVGAAYHLTRSWPPVALLTSRLTASSGEALVVAFHGRPRTRSFGEPTAGVPTANIVQPLSDGAALVVTTALDVDRTGHSYDDAIAPDQRVGADWTLLGTRRDPVLRAAMTWLRHQPNCAG